jgi:choline monooxygenase
MSRHALNPEHYTSQATFELERERLFGRLWTFVGFASMVAEKNRFFTRKVAGVPVLVQRTDAGIRAFLNQCPHRLSAIQLDSHGKRPLVCPYHAWSFGPEGELRGLPNPGLYQFTAAEREGICLKKLHLREVGTMLFVNLSEQPLALEEQFSSELLRELEEVSLHLDTQVIYSCHTAHYNWKLNMENVKDYNHVPFVHSRTFLSEIAPSVRATASEPGTPSAVTTMLDQGTPPPLASLSYPGRLPLKPHDSWFRPLCEPYRDDHLYYVWYLYPNVNFGSVRGEHFLLQQYDPVSPGRIDYHLWMMTARRRNARTDFSALLSTLIRAERNVIAEDTVVLERLQAGLGAHSPRSMHGDYEEHLVRQHLWYRAHVLGETA